MNAFMLNAASIDAIAATTQPDIDVVRRGEVLLRMRAAGLNYIDVAVATGAYPGVRYPLVPVADGAGEVVAVGEDVDGLKSGDRVAVHPKALWSAGRPTARNASAMRGVNLPGALREFAAVPADSVAIAPAFLSWPQIAVLPIAATTAWNALASAAVGPGMTVGLLGTGGVSVFGLQFAKARGARVIIASSSDEKLGRARALGADHTINYRSTPGWDATMRELTQGTGVDLLIETVGPATFARSLAAVRQGGMVFTVGFLSGSKSELDLMPIIARSIRVQGNNTGSTQDLRDALGAIEAQHIVPVVDRVYGVDTVQEPYRALVRGGSHFGKLAISLDW